MKISYRAAAAAATAAVALLGFANFAAPAGAKSPGTQTSVIYNSVVDSPLPGNLPSVGAEAYAFNEFGNQVGFSGTNRQLTNVVVTMSSWGCVTGHWYSGDCSTPAGATFSEPITLNIYNPPAPSSDVPGTLITTVTETVAAPYRPSASPKCGSGEWWDSSLKTCFNGMAFNVTFNLGSVTVPNSVVYGIAYNTSHYGYHPITDSSNCPAGGCGYDSLNIALSQDPTNLTVGTDPNQGTVFQYSPYGSQYCDGGAAGTSVFRLDSPGVPSCWGVSAPYTSTPYYVPAVQFKAGGGR